MSHPRVFVSSVVEGFEEFRAAARRGIERAGGKPVLVNEDFPADPRSARNACLDAVASSDVYLVIIGERGGWIAPSGKPVVEEEYDEARARRLPILAFLQTTRRDAAGEAFANKLSNFVDGQFRRSFASADELEAAVYNAVGGMIPNSSTPPLRRDVIEERFRARPRIVNDATLCVVVAPERDEEVITPVDIMSSTFVRDLYEIGHGGSSPLLDYRRPKTESVQGDSLTIHQLDRNGHQDEKNEVCLSVDERGIIEIETNITSRGRPGMNSFASALVITIPDVEDRLRSAFAFVRAFYDRRDPFKRHQRFNYNVAVLSLGNRRFTRETTARSSYGMNMSAGNEPVIVHPGPRLIGRC